MEKQINITKPESETAKGCRFDALVMPPSRILDLFCKAGGASMGLHYAFPNAEIVGVDIEKQPNYPFRFEQSDAMEYNINGYDFIWASPPCQQHSRLNAINKNSYKDYIAPIRERLQKQGVPFCIENVPGAPLINPIVLCGTMFGLQVIRHRLFECYPRIKLELRCNHYGTPGTHRFPYKPINNFVQVTGNNFSETEARQAMGINWMNKKEWAQAIPPAYSYWLGSQIAKQIYSVRRHNRLAITRNER